MQPNMLNSSSRNDGPNLASLRMSSTVSPVATLRIESTVGQSSIDSAIKKTSMKNSHNTNSSN